MTGILSFFKSGGPILVFSLPFFFFPSFSFSQTNITGKVTDKDGNGLPGVTVFIQVTNRATLTDSVGRFTLLGEPGAEIEFSHVGYNPQKIVLTNKTELDVSLVEASVTLNEVVLVGYGTSQRKDITGAVATVTESEFVVGNVADPLKQIQGKIAGVVIVQPGGDPNGDFTVRIRGATSLEGQPPLLVIDGVALDDFYKSIHTLNPMDIESYTVLKDASAAAIYGARGANGVILVTTKKGKAGKPSVDYHGYSSVEKIAKQLDFLRANQWREATREMNVGSLDQGGNTDWQQAISQTGFLHSHTVGISGGSDELNFRGSIGYLKHQGAIINTGKEVITSRLTANQKTFNDKLEIRYGINTLLVNRDFLPDQTSTSLSRTGGERGGITGGERGGIFDIAMKYLPVWPAYNTDGSYFLAPHSSPNPLFVVNEHFSKQKEFFFQSSVKGDYEVLKILKFGVLGALSRGSDTYDQFWPALAGFREFSVASKSNNNKQVFTGDIHVNYRNNFGKHALDVTGVYEYNKFLNDGFSVTAEGFLVPELINNNLGTATNVQTNGINSYKNEVKLISYLARAVYSYDDRYIVTANFRRDGSSKFGPNNRWGNFTSFAFAWGASKETFLRDAHWLDLKVRLSYGHTGNQENLDPYKYQRLYEPFGPYLYDGRFLQSYAVTQENNPDLKWEVKQSFNIGLDFSLWGDRLYGTIDIFRDKTKDLLFTYGIPQPPFLTSEVIANAASAANKGIEITIGASIVKTENFLWDAQANVSTLRNRITGLLGTFKSIALTLSDRSYGYASGGALGMAPVTKLEVGYPAGVFWIPQHAGFDSGGNELFNNYNTEGKIIGTSSGYTEQDHVYIDPTPDFTWGLTNNFTYRNFDLSIFFRGVQGQKIFSNSLMRTEALAYLPGQNVTDRALSSGFSNLPYQSTYWLRDGSFARLENVTLGYYFRNLKGIRKLRLYIAATNLFVITGYEGIDPEIRTEGSQRYIDFNYYPKTRSFTVGLDVGL